MHTPPVMVGKINTLIFHSTFLGVVVSGGMLCGSGGSPAMLYICDSVDVDSEVLVSAGISRSHAAISVRNPCPHCNKWFITHSAGMQVPLMFAFVHLFSLLTQCVFKREWWFHTSPCYQQDQSLCSSHMGITEVCVSCGSTLPSQASSVLLFPILISLRSEWDHFSSVQWPEEHRRQRVARCMRHPCDGIIWATRSSQRAQGSQQPPQHWHWQQKQKASFFSKQVKSQVYEMQAEHFASVPFKAKRER